MQANQYRAPKVQNINNPRWNEKKFIECLEYLELKILALGLDPKANYELPPALAGGVERVTIDTKGFSPTREEIILG